MATGKIPRGFLRRDSISTGREAVGYWHAARTRGDRDAVSITTVSTKSLLSS